MSFVPATANRDLWVVLGVMVIGALALVGWNRRQDAGPDETVTEEPQDHADSNLPA
jgi:hypothetical protein